MLTPHHATPPLQPNTRSASTPADDQVLFEDATVNRLMEALTLFEEVVSSRYFESTSIILFLNKRDLFAEKVRGGGGGCSSRYPSVSEVTTVVSTPPQH